MDVLIEPENTNTVLPSNQKPGNNITGDQINTSGGKTAIVTKTKWLCFSSCCSSAVTNTTKD